MKFVGLMFAYVKRITRRSIVLILDASVFGLDVSHLVSLYSSTVSLTFSECLCL